MTSRLAKFRQTYQHFVGLLSGSFFMTLARAVALTYLVLVLHQTTPLQIETIGAVVGGATLVGGILSFLLGGMLDFVNSRLVLSGLGIASAAVFMLVPLAVTPWILAVLLVVLTLAYSLMVVAIKSVIAESATPELGQKVFSFRYSLTNIAYGTGPLLGAVIIEVSVKAAFWAAAVFSLIASFAFRSSQLIDRTSLTAPSGKGIFSPLRQALRDARLIRYSLGGFIASIAMREFPSYITMFLIAVNYQNITSVVSVIIIVNNGMIVTLQVAVTSAFSRFSLKTRMAIGLLLLSLGLVGFLFSHALVAWGCAMALFTLGEMIIVPTEFALIEEITPPDQRSGYFAMQNLAALGGSLSPILCGFVLAALPAQAMFIALVICCMLAMIIYGSVPRALLN